MSGFNNNSSGMGNVAEFQSSGWPWVTSSVAPTTTPQRIDFPYVTSEIHVRNNGSTAMAVGFTLNGTKNGNRFEIPGSSSVSWKIKTNKLFLIGLTTTVNYSLMAGLTGIEYIRYPTLTGSANLGTLEVSYGLPNTYGSGSGLG